MGYAVCQLSWSIVISLLFSCTSSSFGDLVWFLLCDFTDLQILKALLQHKQINSKVLNLNISTYKYFFLYQALIIIQSNPYWGGLGILGGNTAM